MQKQIVKTFLKKNEVKHYKQRSIFIQPIELCVAPNLNFCQGNLIKYISRCTEKGEHLDLDKALDYLYWCCQIIENRKDNTIMDKFLKLNEDAETYNLMEFKNMHINFFNQHDDQLIELLIFAIESEAQSIYGITDDLIKNVYLKFNEISKQIFNQALLSNLFYDKYMEMSE